MEIQRFLSLLAALFGIIGAIFLSKGVLCLSPKDMVELTPPHSRMGYAPEQIASFASQKADTITGVVYILMAFLIQALSLLFFNASKFFFKSNWMGFWVAVAALSIITIVFSFANTRICKWYRIEMGKYEIKSRSVYYVSKKDFSERFVRETESMAKELLDLKRLDNESNGEFVRKVFKFVEFPNSDQVDFSKYDSEDTNKK